MNKFAKDNNYYKMINGITMKYITIHNDTAFLAAKSGYYEYFEEGTEPLTYIDTNIKS